MSQKPGFLSQNAGLRDAPRPYVRGSGTRQLSLVVVTIASLIVAACASPTAPQAAPKAGKASFDATTDSTGRIGTLGSG